MGQKMALEKELETFEALKSELIVNEGKFALIAGSELLGIFDTQADALKEGYRERGLEPFLVKKISAIESISFFTRDYFISCTSHA